MFLTKKTGLCLLILFAVVSAERGFSYSLIYTTNENRVLWHLDEPQEDQPNVIEGGVEFFINRTGTADIANNQSFQDGEFSILRRAFRAWEEIPSCRMNFNDLKLTDQNFLTPVDRTNVILFDENNSTGFFPAGTGVVSYTLLTYEDENFDGIFDGRIVDADLVFNGRDFLFGQSTETDRMNLLAVATHEIGHICGLDHSFHQCLNANGSLQVPTMYPYVFYGDTAPAFLKPDDIGGVIDLYTEQEINPLFHGTIGGKVTFQDGSPIKGVNIIAYRDNQPIVSAVTRSDGTYRMQGVPEGKYILKSQYLSVEDVAISDVSTEFHSQFYPATGLVSESSGITVIPGKKRLGVNFSLRNDLQPDFFEADNTRQQASRLSTDGNRMIHAFYYPGDEDWIRFEAHAGNIYQIWTDHLSFFADPYMELYLGDALIPHATHDNIDPVRRNYAARIQFVPMTDTTCYVRLMDARRRSGASTNFEIQINEIQAGGQLDANEDGSLDYRDLFVVGQMWKTNKKADTGSVDGNLLLNLLSYLKQ